MRSVAAQVPMSYTAFNHFLKGGKPHAETLSRLVRWYLAARHGSGSLPAEEVSAAIQLLRRYIADAGTLSAVRARLDNVVSKLGEGLG